MPNEEFLLFRSQLVRCRSRTPAMAREIDPPLLPPEAVEPGDRVGTCTSPHPSSERDAASIPLPHLLLRTCTSLSRRMDVACTFAFQSPPLQRRNSLHLSCLLVFVNSTRVKCEGLASDVVANRRRRRWKRTSVARGIHTCCWRKRRMERHWRTGGRTRRRKNDVRRSDRTGKRSEKPAKAAMWRDEDAWRTTRKEKLRRRKILDRRNRTGRTEKDLEKAGENKRRPCRIETWEGKCLEPTRTIPSCLVETNWNACQP